MRQYGLWALLLSLAIVMGGCAQTGTAEASPSVKTSPRVPGDGLPVVTNPPYQNVLPHDPKDFTQGLLFVDDSLFESTGRNGESKVRRLNPTTGEVLQSQDVAAEFFGEGLAYFEKKLYQLTWTSGVCLIYDPQNLKLERQLFFKDQGWGLTVSPQEGLLVLSDGSSTLRYLDPSNLISRRSIEVVDGRKQAVSNLNELEWVGGEIWANVWMTDRIARIDPKTGQIVGWILFTDLVSTEQQGPEDVLNGIAYDETGDRLYITGKLWSNIYVFDDVKKTFFKS